MTTSVDDSTLRQAVLDAISEIAPDAEFSGLDPKKGLREQLDLDSMDFLNIVIVLHEKLKVEIPEREYPRLFTLDGAVAYLKEKAAG